MKKKEIIVWKNHAFFRSDFSFEMLSKQVFGCYNYIC